jgi:hypothetical protein
MIWPKVDNIFVWSSVVGISFIAFSTHALQTCHKYKKTLALGQTLLREKTSFIEIRSSSSLIKCLWMSSKHEIEHALMETNAL